MKKIKKIFDILCEAVLVIGQTGVLLLGFERLFKMGIVTNIIAVVIAFALLFYLDIKKEETKDE